MRCGAVRCSAEQSRAEQCNTQRRNAGRATCNMQHATCKAQRLRGTWSGLRCSLAQKCSFTRLPITCRAALAVTIRQHVVRCAHCAVACRHIRAWFRSLHRTLSTSTLSCMMSHLLPAPEIRPPTHVRMDTARVCASCPQQSADCTVPPSASQPASQGYSYYRRSVSEHSQPVDPLTHSLLLREGPADRKAATGPAAETWRRSCAG